MENDNKELNLSKQAEDQQVKQNETQDISHTSKSNIKYKIIALIAAFAGVVVICGMIAIGLKMVDYVKNHINGKKADAEIAEILSEQSWDDVDKNLATNIDEKDKDYKDEDIKEPKESVSSLKDIDEKDCIKLIKELDLISAGDMFKRYEYLYMIDNINIEDGISNNEYDIIKETYEYIDWLIENEKAGDIRDLLEAKIITEAGNVTMHYVDNKHIDLTSDGEIPFEQSFLYDVYKQETVDGVDYTCFIPSYTGMEVRDVLEEIVGDDGSIEVMNKFLDECRIIADPKKIEGTQNPEDMIVQEYSPLYLLKNKKGTTYAHLRLAMVYLNWWYPYLEYDFYLDNSTDLEYIGLEIYNEYNTTYYCPDLGTELKIPSDYPIE